MKKLIVVVLVFIGITLFSAFSWGLLFFNIYNWFLKPIFTELPIINLTEAIGLGIFISAMRGFNSDAIGKNKEERIQMSISSIIYPFVFLFTAWIVKAIIM